MIRLGIVGGANAFHGGVWASILNGANSEEFERLGWAKRSIKHRIEGARVVKIWDVDRGMAESLAKACGIDKVEDNLEAMLDGIDAVIITDDGSMQHQKNGIPFIKKGIPTFIDKPLSPDPDEAVELIE